MPPSRHPSPHTLLMPLPPLSNPPRLRNPHSTPPAQSLQIPQPMARPSMQSPSTPTDIDPQPLKLLVRRRRLNGVVAQDELRGWHEVGLPEVEDGAGRVLQEAFEESVVGGCEPGWLAVWEAGGWVVGHCWLLGGGCARLGRISFSWIG